MLLPFIVLIGAMFLMTRSAKKKQQQAAQMRNEMQPGTGVRTIGGMYATVKEIGDETVLLEVAPGVHAVYAKNSIGAVLEDSEYNRIVHGDDDSEEASDADTVVPDDASSLTEAEDAAPKADLTKKSDEAGAEGQKDGKTDGEADAK
ncbi:MULTISPECIES: preprotein translocase subunit YajC [unclassified Streptomyces]|uniref:preprotein translocase subunit YajC n=1 Tax=unclassified Streptomyces TaxID=2593676 RepID=UPI0016607257|nr:MULTISPECIES: preprotein translocase subunit YajC [unclassified Streptomyces]MBD0711756.1 preprotein translocase subunit YajC [Streptomyces sp. CBMA291]MBD0716458.1 preprotein translocase subunit YajC [Streptomyces sp. CBMA370]